MKYFLILLLVWNVFVFVLYGLDKYKAKKVNLTLDSINNYADGRIFTGSQALKYGFIDSIEGMDKAKEMLISMAQEKFPNDKITEDINYSEYALETTLIELFGINTNNSRIENIIPNSMKYTRTPLYLWE